jgi:hypothetical protein
MYDTKLLFESLTFRVIWLSLHKRWYRGLTLDIENSPIVKGRENP